MITCMAAYIRSGVEYIMCVRTQRHTLILSLTLGGLQLPHTPVMVVPMGCLKPLSTGSDRPPLNLNQIARFPCSKMDTGASGVSTNRPTLIPDKPAKALTLKLTA